MNKLGDVIKHYIDAHDDMSVRKLAEKSGISRGHLSMLKNGRYEGLDPGIGLLRRLADGMDMSLERLLYLAGYTEQEGVEVNVDDLPKEQRRILTEHGLDYLLVTKEAYEKGITPEMLKSIVETITKWRDK